eukprot:SAG22_NODE_9517_length_585_cov_1.281893_2_plen_92_part_01
MNHVQNTVSALFSTGHLVSDHGGAVTTEKYVIGITAEANTRNHVSHTCKPRVLIVQQGTLEKLAIIDPANLSFESHSKFHGGKSASNQWSQR